MDTLTINTADIIVQRGKSASARDAFLRYVINGKTITADSSTYTIDGVETAVECAAPLTNLQRALAHV